jgi:hypothetical protein
MPYAQRYVAFLDILGFSEIVKSTERNERQFEALAKAIEQINSRENELDDIAQFDFRFQTFSDSIVMSVADNAPALLYLLQSIKAIAFNLLGNGLLVRGAISKGALHHTSTVMFGPAFIDAYRIEQLVAKYPRVVIGQVVYAEMLRVRGGLLNPRYRLGDDGPPHLDILQDIGELNSKPVTPELMQSDVIINAQSCQRILQNLIDQSIHEPKHFEKLRWFGIYWNGTVGFTPGALIASVTFPGSRNATWRA